MATPTMNAPALIETHEVLATHRDNGFRVGFEGGLCVPPPGLTGAEYKQWSLGHVRGVFARREERKRQAVQSSRTWL